ncbi:MAG: acyltransferase family protein [Lachnospiraceae bacterium]|nr:acyltransferase family protein [Lachnospiraceae bacterium]
MVYNREYKYDNMKAVLIYLVVLGHMLSKFAIGNDTADIIYKIIFSFHMPAFLFVSGYFAKNDSKTVLKSLVPLYLLFQMVNYLVGYAVKIREGTFSVDSINIQFFTPRYTLWYLLALLVYQLLIPLVSTDNKRHRIIITGLSVLAGILMGYNEDTANFMGMSRIVCFFPFFLMGYYERDGRYITGIIGKHRTAVRAATAVLFLLLVFITAKYYKVIDSTWLCHTESYHDTDCTWYIRILVYLAAVPGILFLMAWSPEKKIPYISVLGQNTLSVYLLHAPAIVYLKSVDRLHVYDGNLPVIFISSLLMTVFFSWKGFNKILRRVRI